MHADPALKPQRRHWEHSMMSHCIYSDIMEGPAPDHTVSVYHTIDHHYTEPAASPEPRSPRPQGGRGGGAPVPPHSTLYLLYGNHIPATTRLPTTASRGTPCSGTPNLACKAKMRRSAAHCRGCPHSTVYLQSTRNHLKFEHNDARGNLHGDPNLPAGSGACAQRVDPEPRKLLLPTHP